MTTQREVIRALRGARSPPGRASAEADPGLEKGEEGTPKWILKGRPACGVPAVLSPRPHRTGRFQPPRPPLFGTLCGAAPCGAAFGVPLAPYGRARLVVAGGRMSSGPALKTPHGAFRESLAVAAAARVGR